jgi:hypothetical protein
MSKFTKPTKEMCDKAAFLLRFGDCITDERFSIMTLPQISDDLLNNMNYQFVDWIIKNVELRKGVN